MTTKKMKNFKFWIIENPENKALIDFLLTLTKDSKFSQFAIKALDFARINGMTETDLDALNIRKIRADVEFREAHRDKEIEIVKFLRWKNQFIDTFGEEPTDEALQALIKRKKEESQLKEIAKDEQEKIIEKNYVRFVTIRDSTAIGAGASGQCDICKYKNNYDSNLEAHTDLKRHVGAMHLEKLLA